MADQLPSVQGPLCEGGERKTEAGGWLLAQLSFFSRPWTNVPYLTSLDQGLIHLSTNITGRPLWSSISCWCKLLTQRLLPASRELPDSQSCVCQSQRSAIRLHSSIHSFIHSITHSLSPHSLPLEVGVRMTDGANEENSINTVIPNPVVHIAAYPFS